MTIESIRDLLDEQAVLRDLEPADLDLLAGCGVNQVFAPGAVLAREGEDAEWFWVVRSGRAAVELFGRAGPLVVETHGPINDEALLAPLRGKVAPWWIPDEIIRVARMHLSPTGKIDKVRLRMEYGESG